MSVITIKDRPCGWGKTTEMIQGFDNDKKYLVVVPFLSETERVESEARNAGVEFWRPGFTNTNRSHVNKGEHLRELIESGKNIVCTHELFYRMGSLASERVHKGLRFVSPIHDYNLVIDEVLDPFSQYKEVSQSDFRRDYLGLKLVEILEDGRISPTKQWDERHDEGGRTFKRDMYHQAKSGSLYSSDGDLIISTIPRELLVKPETVTVLTFLNEGSFFRHHIENICRENEEINFQIDALDSSTLSAWREDVMAALQISSIAALENIRLSYSGQTMRDSKAQKAKNGDVIGNCLSNFRYREHLIKDVPISDIGLTCAKSNWFANSDGGKPKASNWAKNSRMFGHPQRDANGDWTTSGLNWIANTTRGTNKYSNCSHAIYLYDQHPNPQVTNFIARGNPAFDQGAFKDAYALTELLQWLFRFQIRKGGLGRLDNGTIGFRGKRLPTALFIPSKRMRNLLENWLVTGKISSNKVSYELAAE